MRDRDANRAGSGWNTACNGTAAMTTMGDLVSVLFTRYERRYGSEDVAAIATQVALEELLRKRAQRRKAA